MRHTKGRICIVNWNVAWPRKARRAAPLLERISAYQPDVVCVTEAYRNFLGRDGHQITSSSDYGYDAPVERRKVILWSRHPWRDVDRSGNRHLPSGRFVRGTTKTNLGEVTFVGVCIPWRDAHVRTGRKDRKPWADHLAYLEGLRAILAGAPPVSTVVLGDFNQRIPRHRQPQRTADALTLALGDSVRVVTNGTIPEVSRPTIDHIALSPNLAVASVNGISNYIDTTAASDQLRLSDHFGLVAELMRTES
jgi:endonuclease/exonuclease/phosphatase family metal-dependent hydrolase